MNILQFQLEEITEEEYNLIPKFCKLLSDMIFTEINTSIVKLKIQLRIPYLYKVPWINWKIKNITTKEILNTIYDSFTYSELKNNTFKLNINTQNLIPQTTTSIDRLIRFLDYGDLNYKGIGFLTVMEHKYNAKQLNSLWKLCVIKYLGYLPESKIIGVQ